MTDTITLTGLVATQPKHLVTSEGLSITSFRLASTQRRFDRSQERWIDGDTNWYTITTFRQLAINVVGSVHKGDRIVTTGRLRIRDWAVGEKAGTNIEVDADSLGHDLLWGTAVFSRSISAAIAESASSAVNAEGALDDEELDDKELDDEQLDGSGGLDDRRIGGGVSGGVDHERQVSLDSLAVPF